MTLPAEPNLVGCMTVVETILLAVRMMGWRGEKRGLSAEEAHQVAQLANAVHNIPGLIQRWHRCDESWIRSVLADFDEEWRYTDKPGSLLPTYLKALSSAEARVPE